MAVPSSPEKEPTVMYCTLDIPVILFSQLRPPLPSTPSQEVPTASTIGTQAECSTTKHP